MITVKTNSAERLPGKSTNTYDVNGNIDANYDASKLGVNIAPGLPNAGTIVKPMRGLVADGLNYAGDTFTGKANPIADSGRLAGNYIDGWKATAAQGPEAFAKRLGNVSGSAAFEVGSMALPATKLSKLSTLSKMGGTAERLVAREVVVAETTGPRLIGSYTPSANLKFGTTLFGDEAHAPASRMLTDELTSRGVPLGSIIDRTGPGLRGVDMSIDPIYAKKLGFEHIEIKPNSESGLSTMNRQIRKWDYDPRSVRPVTYDANGNIRDGFNF
ncbi:MULTISPECIES: hypothetical protein [Asticcacaulis]|uniref:hypothetical protein n=1 Tax=Asticcacaulis TaxID=76890 RepID=UPI001AE25063|nr:MULTISPECIES: hypothetical protein [Asticcacaulis]MBP2161594.1 hypothetical protein [Asticcacaulis solisilvae]MDR6802639.1 hypothetical protein [Asticcacaulis sp. BE141]